MTNKSTLSYLAALLCVLQFSCKKDQSQDTTTRQDNLLSVQAAKEILSEQLKEIGNVDSSRLKNVEWDEISRLESIDSNVVFKVPIKTARLLHSKLYLVFVKENEKIKVLYQQQSGIFSENRRFRGRLTLRDLKGDIYVIKRYNNGLLSLSAKPERTKLVPPTISSTDRLGGSLMTSPQQYYCIAVGFGILVRNGSMGPVICQYNVSFSVCATSGPSTNEIYQKLVSRACQSANDFQARATEIRSIIEQMSMDLGARWLSDENSGEGLFDPDNPENPVNNPTGTSTTTVKIKTDSLYAKYPCVVKVVYNKLRAISGYSAMLSAFYIPGRKPDLSWNARTLGGWGIGTLYQAAETSVPASSYTGASSDVVLNKGMIEQASEFLVAATMIHETYHAYLNYFIAAELGVSYWPEQPNYIGSFFDMRGLNDPNVPSNYSQHLVALEAQFTNMVTILRAYTSNQYSEKQCAMAMVIGMNNAGTGATPSEQTIINNAYNAILTKYSISTTDMDTFKLANVNAPLNLRVPTSCP